MSLRIAVIPDVQAKHGVDLSHLADVGRYIADKQPQIIVCMGDFADMESLSSYDKGKKSFEGRRYKKDIEAAKRAMDILMDPIAKTMKYRPKMHLLYGNHEDRIDRAVEIQPEFDGVISKDDLSYESWGWETHEFLKPIFIEGVAFSHYFVSGPMCRPITTARALLNKLHASAIAGHQQTLDIARTNTLDGRAITTVIAGSCYTHKENYLGPQGNNHWRGMLFLNDVRGGDFDLMPLTLRYLRSRYEQKPTPQVRSRSSARGTQPSAGR